MTTTDGSGPVDSDDPLLDAFGQFIDAVAWLRPRAHTTAGQALADAITDWLNENGHSRLGDDECPAVLGEAVGSFIAVIDVAAFDADATAEALAEAIVGWSAAMSAEHHGSRAFRPRRTR